MLFYSFFQSYFVSMEKAHIYQKIKGSKDNLIFFSLKKWNFPFCSQYLLKYWRGGKEKVLGNEICQIKCIQKYGIMNPTIACNYNAPIKIFKKDWEKF